MDNREIEKLIGMARANNNSLDYNLILYAVGLNASALLSVPDVIKKLNEQGIVIKRDDGLVDPDAPNGDIRPFDPSQVNIIEPPMTMDSLIKRIQNQEVEFYSSFQRKAGLWSDTQKSQLIESILLRIPLPAFYFDATNDDKWLIIDGLQRTTAIKEFVVDGTLQLTGMEFFPDLNKHKFAELPRSFQRRIEETHIMAYKICQPTPINVKFNIFKRLNTGGLTLKPQEIRNALFQGKASEFLKKAANCNDFVKATQGKIDTDRMLDREFVLRFIAFCYFGFDKYDGDIECFLNDTMDWMNKQEDDALYEIRTEFEEIMHSAYEIFGDYAFQKIGQTGRHHPINKAVYVDWCYILYHLEKKDRCALAKRSKELMKVFQFLCANRNELWNSSSKTAIYTQFDVLQTMVQDVLRKK